MSDDPVWRVILGLPAIGLAAWFMVEVIGPVGLPVVAGISGVLAYNLMRSGRRQR